jgi:hypothetical protein
MKGVAYIDNNNDNKYTPGEETSDVHIRLTYTKLDGTQLLVSKVTTGADGAFAFSSLIPGEYTVNATKVNTSTKNLDYLTEQIVTLIANKTSWVNISLAYAPVTTRGYTTYDTAKIPNIPITFAPDKTVKNNTATKQVAVTSDAQGLYVAKLTPGIYNVTVKKTEGVTTVYTYTDKVSVFPGEGNASYDIALTKVSVTVSGSTLYNGVGKSNMTVVFTKDLSIANNTALTKSITTNINGNYTIELTPGAYNVSVEKFVNESGQNVTYRGAAHITLLMGEKPNIRNIILTREVSP